MNGSGNLEEKLRKIRLDTPSSTDEQILTEATAQFERASKLRVGRSRRTITTVVVIILIVAVFAAIVFLTSRGEVKRSRPRVTERQEVTDQPVQIEKPKQPEIQPQPRRPEIKREDKPSRRKQAVNDTEAKLAHISSLADAGDINGLVDILKTGDIVSRMAAVKLLSNMSDEGAQEALNELAATLDPNNPEDYFLADALGVEDFGLSEEETAEDEAKAGKVTEPNTPAAKKEQPTMKSLTGWLTDVNGYTVEGKIQVGRIGAMTDDNGAFSIEQPNFAEFISCLGYAVSTDGNMGTVFQWYENDDLNGIEIVCMPSASASGSVIDVNGQPVNDLQIKIVPDVNAQSTYVPDELKRPWKIKIETDGSFEISSIPTGCPLVLIISKDNANKRIPLDVPAPGGHLPLGEITLEAVLEEDSIDEGG